MYDCLIIGAGPAGSSAAYHLAKRGRKVLVLEKDTLPHAKPCGGGVAPSIRRWFDVDFSPVIDCTLDHLRYTWRLEEPVDIPLTPRHRLWMVNRTTFDDFLLEHARRQGAMVRDGAEVAGITYTHGGWQATLATGETVDGRYLVAADGATGPTAKWLGFTRRKYRRGVSLVTELAQPPALPGWGQIDFGLAHFGYCWNFPRTHGMNLGVGSFNSSGQNFRVLLQEYAGKLHLDLDGAKILGHILLLWHGQQPLHTQQALLVGEAACLVDPFTAEGIRWAVFSGCLAADAIDPALAGDRDALPHYSQAIHAGFGVDMVWAHRLSDAFFRLPRLAYRLFVTRPKVTERILDVMTGDARYEDVARRALKRLMGG